MSDGSVALTTHLDLQLEKEKLKIKITGSSNKNAEADKKLVKYISTIGISIYLHEIICFQAVQIVGKIGSDRYEREVGCK